MKKIFLLFIIFSSLHLRAQVIYDWGISAGATNYLGDIGGTDEERNNFYKDIKITETRWAYGGFFRAQVSRTMSLSVSAMVGKLEGWDSHTTYAPRRVRNLNFRNQIQEVALRGEFALFSDNDVGGKGYYNTDFKMFTFVGIAGIHHNPEGNLNGKWYELRDLNTEARFEPYSKFAYSIPMGFGFYFSRKRKHRFSWEFGYRISSTDYLDDISKHYAYESELLHSGGQLAVDIANQSSPELAQEAFGDPEIYYNYSYGSGQQEAGLRNPRGSDDNNDGYMFMVVSYGHVLPVNSELKKKFSKKSVYNRIKRNRRISSKRKSRAKF